MKKIFLILFVFLTIIIQAQSTVKPVSVPNDSTAIGQNLGKNNLLIDASTGTEYQLTAGIPGTGTIRGNIASLQIVNNDIYATKVALQDKLNISDTASMLLPYHSNVFKFELTKNDTIIDLGVSLKSGALTFLNGILLKPSQWNVSGNSVLLLLNIQNYDNLIIKN